MKNNALSTIQFINTQSNLRSQKYNHFHNIYVIVQESNITILQTTQDQLLKFQNQLILTNINLFINSQIQSSFRFLHTQTRMRSFSPQIIKHYLPLEFSKDVVDYHPSNLKTVGPYEENPLTNILLRNLQKINKREFVLTFTNKTNTQFKPKKQVTYHNLFQQLEGGQQKLQLMKRELINYQEKEDYTKNRTNLFQKQKLVNKNREIFSSRQHRTHNKISSITRNISSAQSTKLYQQKRLSQRIYSSMNFKQGKTINRDHYTMTPKTTRTKNQYNPFTQSQSVKDINTLRIKGNKAPEAQMIDHWKKNSVDSSSVFIRSSR